MTLNAKIEGFYEFFGDFRLRHRFQKRIALKSIEIDIKKLRMKFSALNTHCVSKKNIPNIFDCNYKKNYQILIIFGANIPETTCQQIAIQFPTSPNFCFCTTKGMQTMRNTH